LGTPEHGRWLLAPAGEHRASGRRYRLDTLVLETEFTTADGAVRLVDCMPVPSDRPEVFRRVEGLSGRVQLRNELALRLDYGHVVPWFREVGRRTSAFAGPDTLTLDSDIAHDLEADAVVAEFDLAAGQNAEFRLTWSTHRDLPPPHADVGRGIAATERWWREWTAQCCYDGEYREAVVRSLITLKAMSYGPSGGLVAAPTASLPEHLGGVRNWGLPLLLDPRCHLHLARPARRRIRGRGGGVAGVVAAGAGRAARADAADVRGGRRTPADRVRAGLAARVRGIAPGAGGQRRVRAVPARRLRRADGRPAPGPRPRHPAEGIWEVRGGRRQFTHSKVMAWAAVDRAIRAVDEFGLDGPVDDWKRLRGEIFDDVCERGDDRKRETFTSYYGSHELDAALLLMPSVGFLPADDKRVRGTVAAIERELCRDGFVQRYTVSERKQRTDPMRSHATGSGRVLALQLLAGRGVSARRPSRRGAGGVRAAARPPQRPGAAVGGVRRRRRPAGRELPPSSDPPRAGEHRVRPRLGGRAQPPSGTAALRSQTAHRVTGVAGRPARVRWRAPAGPEGRRPRRPSCKPPEVDVEHHVRGEGGVDIASGVPEPAHEV
jgi:hypothetical protein